MTTKPGFGTERSIGSQEWRRNHNFDQGDAREQVLSTRCGLSAPGHSAHVRLYRIVRFWCGPGINDAWDTRAEAAAAAWNRRPQDDCQSPEATEQREPYDYWAVRSAQQWARRAKEFAIQVEDDVFKVGDDITIGDRGIPTHTVVGIRDNKTLVLREFWQDAYRVMR